jgi:hypothetical protein
VFGTFLGLLAGHFRGRLEALIDWSRRYRSGVSPHHRIPRATTLTFAQRAFVLAARGKQHTTVCRQFCNRQRNKGIEICAVLECDTALRPVPFARQLRNGPVQQRRKISKG